MDAAKLPGTQSVLRFADSPATPVFAKLLPRLFRIHSVLLQGRSRRAHGSSKPGVSFRRDFGASVERESHFAGQYNESPLEPKGASALYEFQPWKVTRPELGWMYGRA